MHNHKGITLVSLVVTVVILIILTGITINMVVGNNNLINASKTKSEEAQRKVLVETIRIELLDKQREVLGRELTQQEIENILKKYGTINYEEDGTTIKGVTTSDNYEILLQDIWYTVAKDDKVIILADGSWNGTVNTPKLEGTGLIAVYWDEISKNWIELTSSSSQEEWNNWYDYSNKKWANARSKDGSMWVWIPRYEYKIDSANKIIDVRFIETNVKKGTSGYITDNTGITTSNDNYIIHPAFMNDSSNGYNNGGWDKELPGFWIAKYVAGYQNGTVGEKAQTVQYSSLKYTEVSSFTSNFLTDSLSINTNLSYPVFKANTYAYNIISVGDAYLLAKEIDNASMYGLSNVDSHLVKNSEWGAVAYLTHSKYGVNGYSSNMNEVEINSKNLNNSIYVNNDVSGTKANVYGITSYGPNDEPNDITASSTKNRTGVFDLNGCIWERTAGYLKGGVASTPAWHNAMASSSTTASSKYVTLYTENNKKGDATNETAGWNADEFSFVTSNMPVFQRCGTYSRADKSGIFAFATSDGYPNRNNGFRACLAF